MSTAGPSSETQREQIVVFSLSDGEYALRMRDVKEIIPYTTPRAVNSQEPMVQGVISLRGKIIPVCDLGTRLLPTGSDAPHRNIIVVEAGDIIAGVLVQRVEEVRTIDTADLAHVNAAATLTNTIARVDERLIVLLDAGTVLDGLNEFA